MHTIHHSIEVPPNGTVHVEFTRNGDVIGEAKVVDALHVYEATGRRERAITLEAGPVSTDASGERHGADDGGEGWGLLTLPLLPGDEQDPPVTVMYADDRWTVACGDVNVAVIRNVHGHILVHQEGGISAIEPKGLQALVHLVNSGELP